MFKFSFHLFPLECCLEIISFVNILTTEATNKIIAAAVTTLYFPIEYSRRQNDTYSLRGLFFSNWQPAFPSVKLIPHVQEPLYVTIGFLGRFGFEELPVIRPLKTFLLAVVIPCFELPFSIFTCLYGIL